MARLFISDLCFRQNNSKFYTIIEHRNLNTRRVVKMEKIRICCSYGYGTLGRKPTVLDTNAEYVILKKSFYYPFCYWITRVDGKEYKGETKWLVHICSIKPI